MKVVTPFIAARVFISHACKDHQFSEYIARKLEVHFDVYYSCNTNNDSRNMHFDDSTIPDDELAKSDLVLFLASENSLRENSNAKKELSIARSLNVKTGWPSLVIIKLGEAKIHRKYLDTLIGSFCWNNREKDVTVIIQKLKEKLAKQSKYKINKDDNGALKYLLTEPSNELLNKINDFDKFESSLLPFNAVFRSYEMSNLLKCIKQKSDSEQSEVFDKLLKMFFDTPDSAIYAKQNAVFILGKLNKGQTGLVNEFKKRMPDYNNPFLFRGFNISHAFFSDGKNDFMNYMKLLATESGSEWDKQRLINKNYHILYYHGLAGAIRESIEAISEFKPSLLPLNVFTLGELSCYNENLKFLREKRCELIVRGVSAAIIDNSIQKIENRLI